MKKGTLITAIIGVAVIAVFIIWGAKEQNTPGQYDQFAQCIKDSGTIFYGAWWCPHCQNQKKMFGKSAKLLPYEECSTPDGNGVLQVCKDAGIEGYPTWVFGDGSRQSGEIPLATLAEKTSCTLPQ
jgi:hypothetical protein